MSLHVLLLIYKRIPSTRIAMLLYGLIFIQNEKLFKIAFSNLPIKTWLISLMCSKLKIKTLE